MPHKGVVNEFLSMRSKLLERVLTA